MRSLFDIGVGSLMAYQYALSVTSQNMANSQVDSYCRRDVIFSQSYGGGFGNGVTVADTRRIFDSSLDRNLQLTNSAQIKADTYLNNLQSLELLFEENDYSIASYINQSLTALNVINANPASVQSRSLYLYQLNNVASRFNAIDDSLNSQQTINNSSITSDVTAVNTALTQLGALNAVILNATPEEQADLLDQRDGLLTTLSGLINYESQIDNQGILSIQLTNGTPLLLGTTASTLVAYPTASDPSKLDIGVTNNQVLIPVTNFITTGEIGGLLAYQTSVLDVEKNSLGRLALVIGETFNAQNRLGIDLYGNLGGNLFNDSNLQSTMKNRVIANLQNQGFADLNVMISNVSQLTTSDYQLVFDSSSHYQITRLSDNQIVASADISSYPASFEVDGFSIFVNDSNFVVGDKFTLSPTKNASRELAVAFTDPSRLALGLPVITSPSMLNNGTGSLSLTAVTDTSNGAFSIPGNLTPPIRVEFITSTTYRLINADNDSIIEDMIPYDPQVGVDVFPTDEGYDPGYRVKLSGTMVSGDQFNINYNVNGTGDNRNGLLLAGLYQQGIAANNTLNFTTAYDFISSDIASKTNTAISASKSTATLNAQAQTRRDAVSGVSMPEELMNLSRFDEAFQASAQIIEAGQKIFDTIIGMARR